MTPASRSAQSLGLKVRPSKVMPWMKTSLALFETIDQRLYVVVGKHQGSPQCCSAKELYLIEDLASIFCP
jgi:hypothetical protein